MKHYCPKCGRELGTHQFVCPGCSYCEFTDNLEKNTTKATTILTAEQLELNTQWTKYRCGKDGLCGHGFAAEDLNALSDINKGYKVDLSGRDNSKYGADRTVNGVQIQTKYYKTPQGSVNAAFDKTSGNYAYWDADTGNPQVLEVPSDQYDKCVELMRERILEGKVVDANGNKITDPNEATSIVKKGNYTYTQAKNVTKAGNFDSLKFDLETGVVTAISAFGISFTINLGMMLFSKSKTDLSLEEAVKLSFLEGLKSGTISMSSHVLTSQVLKTTMGRNMAAFATRSSKGLVNGIWEYDAGKQLVQKVASNIIQKKVSGGAAKNVLVKFIRTNTVAQLSMFIVTSVPDTIDLLRCRISAPQFIKNMVVSGCSFVGMTVGAIIGKYGGTWGSLGGAVVVGTCLGWASKKVANLLHKDDSERMQKIVKAAIIELSNDYLIQTEDEFDSCMRKIYFEKAINTDLLKCMQAAGKGEDGDDDFLRARIAYSALEYYFYATIRERKKLLLENNGDILNKYLDDLAMDFKEETGQMDEYN